MSYYILPKNNNNITVEPLWSQNECEIYISHSLFNYFNMTKGQLLKIIENNDMSYNEAIELINPHEFIFSKVPGSKFSVSKLKPKTNLFYDLLEISNNLNVFDSFKNVNQIQITHISQNYDDSIECFEIFREGYNDSHIFCETFDLDNILNNVKSDFIFYETELNKYHYSFTQALAFLLKNQKPRGNAIIKIGDIFHKPVVDILYFLTSLYDKVYVTKPSTNNVTSFSKYIVCKNFHFKDIDTVYLRINYLRLIVFLKRLENKNITNILGFDVPCYFRNKIDDLNIIIGQQQLDSLNQIISIYKNKNKEEKLEILKKNNIQKSVFWCEKYKIPCNKFTEKINIFLPIINDII